MKSALKCNSVLRQTAVMVFGLCFISFLQSCSPQGFAEIDSKSLNDNLEVSLPSAEGIPSVPDTRAPAAETPVSQTPASETPVSQTPASETPVSQTPASETPVSQTPASQTPPLLSANAYKGSCSVFKDQPLVPLVIPATAQNRSITMNLETLTVDSARNVDITTSLEKVIVKSADKVRLSLTIAGAQIRANEITSVDRVFGESCLFAEKVGTVSMGFGSGDSSKLKIIANTVDKIEMGFTKVHVYKATVKVVAGNFGSICLHDGAKILAFEGQANFGTVEECQD